MVFIFSVAVFLSSCATYKIAHDFTPPATKEGLVCLTGCQSQLKQCNRSCSIQFKQCAVKAEQQAKILLPGLLVAYPRQLKLWLKAREDYRRELDWYEFRRDMAESRRESRIDRCEKKGATRRACYNKFDAHYFSHDRPSFTLQKPVKPSLASEATNIRKASCSSNCACNKNYRLCYGSCGGVVKSKKVCIKNCGN